MDCIDLSCLSDLNCQTNTDCDIDQDNHQSISCTGGDDCNDMDYLAYPGAPEIQDGVDNDCNGVVDDVNSIQEQNAIQGGESQPIFMVSEPSTPLSTKTGFEVISTFTEIYNRFMVIQVLTDALHENNPNNKEIAQLNERANRELDQLYKMISDLQTNKGRVGKGRVIEAMNALKKDIEYIKKTLARK